MELYFTFLSPFDEKSILRPDDVHYLYYDVVRLNEMRIELVDWEKDIIPILEDYNAIIENVDVVPGSDLDSNEAYFIVSSSESTVTSLIRHIRNAFSHYRIKRIGEEFYINDGDKMKGRIDVKLLKQITRTIWEIINNVK